MRANTAGEKSPQGLYRDIVECNLSDAAQNEAIAAYLDAETLPAYLVHRVNQSGDTYVPDFMWLYYGHPDTGGHNKKYLPLIERNGRNYTKSLVAGVTDGGTFIHVREVEDSSVELDDPSRYFVATLDLLTPATTEWPIARVRRERRDVAFRGPSYLHTELVLSEGLRLVPGDTEGSPSRIDGERARKLGMKLTEQAFKRMPRIVMGYQAAEFVHDGIAEQVQHSAGEVLRGAERLADLQCKFGHLPVLQVQQSFSQELAV